MTAAAARLSIAQTYGFRTWARFVKFLNALARKKSAVARFEAAADAIVKGDIAKLKRLLREDPKLVRAKSMREHGATLLIYTAANGVEGYRQKSPKNIVKIAELLLDSGAEVDATADVYRGDCTTLGLAATSVWPELAGVQEPLMQLLLDRGARLNRHNSAGNEHSLVFACLANGRPKAAKYLADRGAKLDYVSAAGLGRLDAMRSMKPTKKQVRSALLWGCGGGNREVVQYLLDRGADLTAHQGDGQTAAHFAVIGGHPEILKMLLPHHPPLEAVNMFGGTVFGQATWSAAHGGDPDTYIEILELLTAAGAKLPERHVPVNKRIDAWLAKHGSVAEPSWYWFGEGPPRASRGKRR